MKYIEEKLKCYYKTELVNEILSGMTIKRYTTFRINSLLSNKEEVLKALNNHNLEVKEVPFYDMAYILCDGNEGDLTALDIYNEGKIYLQSLSSMLPPIVLDPKESHAILDMAAAPGGKTTEIAALTNNKAQITACELNKIRSERLKYNVSKQGATSVLVMNTDSRNLDDFFRFDEVLLDAPCSGSGTRSNDEESLKGLTDVLVNKSINAQKTMLKKAFKILKKNGTLVYSTCSIFKCENEDVINSVLPKGKYQIIPIEVNDVNLETLPSTMDGVLTVKPNKYYEGFFIAKIKKIGD